MLNMSYTEEKMLLEKPNYTQKSCQKSFSNIGDNGSQDFAVL